ncbi:hypothetical protein [Streptomyces xanthophaeus]|uniref:hypothetical protein n=1 Tax=Streptomyces xanthophaeus TaxID=67385 RepID=UPI00365A89EB
MDPADVRTPEELKEALKELILRSGKSPDDLARDADVSQATARSMRQGKGGFPQHKPFQAVVAACGGDRVEWDRARQRAEIAREKPPKTVDLAKPAALRDDLVRLAAQVAELTDSLAALTEKVDEMARSQCSTSDSSRADQQAAAYQTFMSTVPEVAFEFVVWIDDGESPLVPSDRGYASHPMDMCIREIETRLRDPDRITELQAYLATLLPFERSSSPNRESYTETSVNAYFRELRLSVREYLKGPIQ